MSMYTMYTVDKFTFYALHTMRTAGLNIFPKAVIVHC